MTPQEKRYIELSRKFEISKGQITQIEGEYDFLIERIQDSYTQDLAKAANGVVNDPEAKKIFPLELISGIKESLKETEDDIELDRGELVGQLKKMNKELQELHLNQSDTFSEMNSLVQDNEIGEYGNDIFWKAQHEDAIDESQESYLDMVDVLSGQYETFNDLR
tara:strand:+ start:500 stop:991 length:492 start_codon:yes stop_codon:yes gene_type:complete